jgi:hypothetical protein
MSEPGNLGDLHEEHRNQLAPFRQLILTTAAQTKGIGDIAESFKWGEPSYTPSNKGIGSSVRLAPRKDGKVSMHFICYTGLVERFRALYANCLEFEGNRTIVIDVSKPVPEAQLRHCIAMALTYFQNK